jgi:hypothetical protein
LVTQLLGDVAASAVRYQSPLAKELMDVLEETSDLRNQWKAIAAKSDRFTTAKTAKPADAPVADANEYEATVY